MSTFRPIHRIKTFLRYGGKCNVCKKELYWWRDKGILEITPMSDAETHHIDKNRHNNNPSNLVLLCNWCHHHLFHSKNNIKIEMDDFSI